MAARSLAEVVASMLKEVGLDASLKGKTAVEAAKKELGITAAGPLKAQIQVVCDQLGIQTGWGGGGGTPSGGGASPTARAVDLSPTKTTELGALRDSAKTAARGGNHTEAVQSYTKCLAIAEEATLYLARAQCQGKVGAFAKMLKDATVCTKLEPDNWKGWDTAGQAQMQLEEWTAAHGLFMKALSINPMNTTLSQNMAKASAAMRAGESTWVAASPAPETMAAAASEEADATPEKTASLTPTDEVLAVMQTLAEGSAGHFSQGEQVAADGQELAKAYDPIMHSVNTMRRYDTIKEVELRADPSAAAAVVGKLPAGKQIRTSHLQADASGAVHLCCLKVQFPESAKLASVGVQHVSAATVDADKLAAALGTAGQLSIVNVAVGHGAVPFEVDWCEDDGADEAEEELKEALLSAFTAANEAFEEQGFFDRRIADGGEEFQQLAGWVLSEMVVSAGMAALTSQSAAAAIEQTRSFVLIGCDGSVRVAIAGFVSLPSLKGIATPFVLRTLTQDLTEVDGSAKVACQVSQTTCWKMDEYMESRDVLGKLCTAAKEGNWDLADGHGFGWIAMSNGTALQVAEDIEAEIDDNGKPRLLPGEKVVGAATAKFLPPHAGAVSSAGQSGVVAITTQRLIYIPNLPHLPTAISLRRISAVSSVATKDGPSGNVLMNIELSVAHGDVSKSGGEWDRFNPASFVLEFDTESLKKKKLSKADHHDFTTKVEAFYFVLQQAVDNSIAADPSFSPANRATADAIVHLEQALGGDKCQDVINGVGKWKSKTLNYAAAANEDNFDGTLKLAASTIAEITTVLFESPQYSAVEKIVASIPGLTAESVLASGGMRLVSPAGVSSEFVLLSPTTFEIHKVLRGAEVPYELTASCAVEDIEDVNSWAGRMIGAGIAGKASLQVRTKQGHKYFLEPHDVEDVAAMTSWMEAIKAAVASAASAGSGSDLGECTTATAKRTVRKVVEQFVLGAHLGLMTQCGERAGGSVGAAIGRMRLEDQDGGLFGLSGTLVSKSNWAAAATSLSKLNGGMLPLEMVETFQRCCSAIAQTYSKEQARQAAHRFTPTISPSIAYSCPTYQ